VRVRIFVQWFITGIAVITVAASAGAQTARVKDPRDLSGIWRNQYTPNLATAIGTAQNPVQPPFTPHGAERWRTVDTAKDPTGFCLPPGPSRAFTAPFPFILVQQQNMIGFLFEYQTIWRAVYMDGRPHPEDILDYPEFMGHSIGKWDGDTLVIDTYGIDERSWLDTAGHEHSGQLRLTERIKKVSENALEWNATFDDPVFFTRPWSITRTFTRFDDSKDRILPYTCTENNRDVDNLVPHQPNLDYKHVPEGK
jgi:hypothetical protein